MPHLDAITIHSRRPSELAGFWSSVALAADAIRRRSEVALARLDELQAVSEGRFDTLISTLRAAINDVKQSAANAGAAAAQARAETLQQVAESVAPLKQRLDVQCS